MLRHSVRKFSYCKNSSLDMIAPSLFTIASGTLFTSIIVTNAERENLYIKRQHEEIIERLKRIEKK